MRRGSNTNFYKRGFSLVELLVVVSIIGLLSSVVIATVSNVRVKAKEAKVKAEVHNIRLAFESYATEHGGYPNPGIGLDETLLWCIGDGNCQIAGTLVTNNTNDEENWQIALLKNLVPQNIQYLAAVIFPNFPDSAVFEDVSGSQNKGYVYAPCNLPKDQYPVCPENPATDDEKAYLIYSKADYVVAVEVFGSFREQTCNPEINDICALPPEGGGPPEGGNNICGEDNNESCDTYSYIAGACNYDPDGTISEPDVMCICGEANNESCNNYCGDPYLGSCNFDPNGNGRAWSQACEATCGCTDSVGGACNYNPNATVDDGSCEYTSCSTTCNDPNACNNGSPAACDYSCYTCSGTFAPNCSPFNSNNCPDQTGCLWGGGTNGYCSGTHLASCSIYNGDYTTCTNQGCTYDDGNGLCNGTYSESCSAGEESACSGGCAWIPGTGNYCYADPNGSCSTYNTDQGVCENLYNCYWSQQ